MEQIRKIIVVAILVCVCCPVVSASDFLPDDVETIEALITAHKSMKAAEDLALAQVGLIASEHKLTENATTALNKTRTVLNKRMADVNSYLTLAAQIASLATKIVNTVERYADFTKYTYQYTLNNPLVLYFYTNANLQIANEIKHMEKLMGGFTATGLNILKATMEEKYRVLSQIDYVIFRINEIIGRANLACRNMTNNGITIMTIEEIINSDLSKSISEELIGLWNQN